ncbi:hypothetical protein E1B28_000942 [Marasmius oreades]|uniref:Sec39 domain-containing protein n=1 Tax=Marasmius oreades TaxID=181124 RepID=A0A9P7V2L5_9AGAR|nr:uncharacterized protein E1B28_000942 [Marasmius oreades]KAG7099067.1 hypothetical protein E1B28_000942 [Marasmius oreades]
MTSPYTRWVDLADGELTVDNVEGILNNLTDDLWAAAACADRLVDDVLLQQKLLQLGLARTDSAYTRLERLLSSSSDQDSLEGKAPSLIEYFKEVEGDALLCRVRVVLLGRLDRLNTYVEVCKAAPEEETEKGSEQNEDEDEEWDDDPWGEGSTKAVLVSKLPPPFSLSEFLSSDLLHSACLLAVNQWFNGLGVVFSRHGSTLWPFRFTILDLIPGHTSPTDYHTLLPSRDPEMDIEIRPHFEGLRRERDWSESSDIQSALNAASIPIWHSGNSTSSHSSIDLKSGGELSSWYHQRVDFIVSSTGMIDSALTLVQHAVSQGIGGLDELGEELSLLSRLVYDSPRGKDIPEEEDWTLDRWLSMDPPAVVRAYLAHSAPPTVSNDISRLVMPYLFVLESRAERSGKSDPSLPTRLLYDYILSAPLNIAVSIFEASKPTLPFSQRLIKHDDDMVRLALACLYGNESLDQWPTMSNIFECLPVWEVTSGDEDAADTTVASLGTFVTPTTARPSCTPSDLLVFFKPLPMSSLSRALDFLDIHLESGEILARWCVPAPLRWFLQSNNDPAEQRAWANRMARRAGNKHDQLDTLQDWEWLLEDMLKLSAKADNKLGGAFCLLSRDEVLRIYLSGLLSTGRFDIARNLLQSRKSRLTLDGEAVESICLSCSREFYDNASSGNYKFGEMKLAYDCLGVPPPSDRLEKEKEFIEATSRLTSFNIMSRPGIPISPIEIRLTKDRLTLVSQVLSSNSDAYKHIEVILDLVRKLGFKDDIVAEVKALAMIADTALQAEDFSRSYETSQRMVDLVLNLRASSMGMDDPQIREASDVCWIACFQLGRQTEFEDMDKKLCLLGRAVEICPADKLHDVLTAWRRLENQDIGVREERLTKRHGGAVDSGDNRKRAATALLNLPESAASTLQERLKSFHMPSPPLLNTPDAAALASRTFKSVAASFPFSRGRSRFSQESGSDRSRSGSRRPGNGQDVSAQASRVFSQGIGWLIGAEEGL